MPQPQGSIWPKTSVVWRITTVTAPSGVGVAVGGSVAVGSGVADARVGVAVALKALVGSATRAGVGVGEVSQAARSAAHPSRTLRATAHLMLCVSRVDPNRRRSEDSAR